MSILTRTAVALLSSVVAVLVCAWVLDDFSLTLGGLITAVVVFTVAQALLSPVVAKLTRRYAEGFIGGVGVVSTLLALWLATLVPGGISLRGVGTWLLAAVIIWLVTTVASLVIAAVIAKSRSRNATDKAAGGK
ncbi:phage holin family protein [Corynebacterium terpenotabidum]|uniref:Uncharacterized protein n=1 Tax=Corynebacterium terpenotabidum Y-11 TaxID=1200352 RepID=S4XES9_9CORY|nr:phage holin family protein [Corynebacterium terpenotabidum]AGP31069.1 hypothetical protein A606_07110 [Corynebacterium terpenotabidum Y-11]